MKPQPNPTADLAANLRRYNAWRRGDDETIDMPHPTDIGKWIDTAASVLERIDPEQLASALWNVSKLRHGLFNPREFRELVEETLRRELTESVNSGSR